jgi:hypothetical protein
MDSDDDFNSSQVSEDEFMAEDSDVSLEDGEFPCSDLATPV